MIVALLAACQLAAATTGSIVVRDASRSSTIPLLPSAAGPVLRPELLAPVLSVQVTRETEGQFRLVVGGVPMTLETGLTTMSVAGHVRQLAAPPLERERRLYVPLQLVSEILPSVAQNLRWDSAAKQLVVFANAAGAMASDSVARRASARTPVRAPAKARPTAAAMPRRTVVVDAGHGGPDAGMHGPIGRATTLYEKDITLDVAKKLGGDLEARGLRVVYTRTTDTLIALSDRGKIANQANGDLFVSIHVNAANPNWREPAGARGFETYFLAEARTEDARRVERMENESVRFETNGEVGRDDPLSFILSDMKQNEHLRESSELAEIIQSRLASMHPGPSRGVKQAGFRVLVTAFMPSVLVEIGFGTNPAEAAFLSDPRRQNAIADAIADAAVEYLRRYERRINGGSEP